MDRDNDERDMLIDLGAASVETKGLPGNQVEFGAIGRVAGIADD